MEPAPAAPAGSGSTGRSASPASSAAAAASPGRRCASGGSAIGQRVPALAIRSSHPHRSPSRKVYQQQEALILDLRPRSGKTASRKGTNDGVQSSSSTAIMRRFGQLILPVGRVAGCSCGVPQHDSAHGGVEAWVRTAYAGCSCHPRFDHGSGSRPTTSFLLTRVPTQPVVDTPERATLAPMCQSRAQCQPWREVSRQDAPCAAGSG